MGNESELIKAEVTSSGNFEGLVSKNDCYVVQYDFLKSIVSSLAWPLVVVIVFIIFKSKLEKLFDRISRSKRFRAGKDGFEFDMPDIEIQLKESVSNLDANLDSVKKDFSRKNKSEIIGEVITKWIELEELLFSIASGVITVSSSTNAFDLARDLCAAKEISESQLKSIAILREFRNRLVHRINFSLSEDAYGKILLLMDRTIKELKTKN